MKKSLLPLMMSVLLSIPVSAQTFDWNVDFTYFLHNTEFDRSCNVTEISQTVNAVRLTPSVGLKYESSGTTHRLMGGIDILHDMGAGTAFLDHFRELTLFYEVETQARRGEFSAIAGIFPRRFAEGDYRWLYFDRNNLFYDNNFEGFFLKWKADGFRSELGLDWTGMYGDENTPSRREIFQVLTSGRWDFLRTLSLGWTGRFHHFAYAPQCLNIVDDVTFSPYVRWSPRTSLDLLEFDLAYVLAFQCDRGEGYTFGPNWPMGVMMRQKGALKGFGLENFLYLGEDLQPFRDIYGGALYTGDMQLHLPTHFAGSSPFSWTDELAVFYSPKITDWLHLDIACAFQFGNPVQCLFPLTDTVVELPFYRGCRQVISLRAEFGKSRMKAAKDNAKKRRQMTPFELFDHIYEL